MHVKILEKKMNLLKMCGPQIRLCLFMFRPIASKRLIKLDYNPNFQLTWWCSGNASALGARGPRFNPRIRQGFLCFMFCFVVVVLLLFLSLFVTKVSNSFYNVKLFSIHVLNILHDLCPIIRVGL